MNEPSRPDGSSHEDAKDLRLASRVRSGDTAAFAVLYERHVRDATRFCTRSGLQEQEAADVVAEVFTALLRQLEAGHGPSQNVRAYLYRSLRHEITRVRVRRGREAPTDVDLVFDRPVDLDEGRAELFDREAVVAAMARLSPRHRSVLWALDVEARKPHEVAGDLGLRPNAVSALALRARGALREAFLAQHVSPQAAAARSRTCRRMRERLPAYVRDTLAPTQVPKVEQHLDTCDDCRAIYLELIAANEHFAAVGLGALLAGGGGSVIAGGSFELSLAGSSAARTGQRTWLASGVVAAAVVAATVAMAVAGVRDDEPPGPSSSPRERVVAVDQQTPQVAPGSRPTPSTREDEEGAEPSPARSPRRVPEHPAGQERRADQRPPAAEVASSSMTDATGPDPRPDTDFEPPTPPSETTVWTDERTELSYLTEVRRTETSDLRDVGCGILEPVVRTDRTVSVVRTHVRTGRTTRSDGSVVPAESRVSDAPEVVGRWTSWEVPAPRPCVAVSVGDQDPDQDPVGP